MRKWNKGNTLLETVITIVFIGMTISSFISVYFAISKLSNKHEKECQINNALQLLYVDILQNMENYNDNDYVYLDDNGNIQTEKTNDYFKIRMENNEEFVFVYISFYSNNELKLLLRNKEEICVKLYG